MRGGHTLRGAWERAGIYDVTVEAEGYRSAHLGGIRGNLTPLAGLSAAPPCRPLPMQLSR